MSAAITILIILFVMMLVLMLAILFHKEPEVEADAGSPVQMKVITDLLPDDEPAETPEDPLDDTDDLLFDQDAIDALFHEEDPEFAPLEEVPEESDFESLEKTEELFPPLTDYPDKDTNENADLLRQGVRIAWPQSDVMMKCAAFGSSLLYVWQGLCSSKEMILFDVHEKKLGYPLLETARSISDQNQKPARRFALLIHTEEDPDPFIRQKASAYLRGEGETPAAVISDAAPVALTDQRFAQFEPITVGTRPHIILSSDDSYETVHHIARQSLQDVKLNEINETALEAFERMKKVLPAGLRMRLSSGIGEKAAAKRIAELIPETAKWIDPSVIAKADGSGSLIQIEAPDDLLLEETMNAFAENMRRNGLAFRMLEQSKGGVPVSVEDDAFILLEKAMQSNGISRTAIPVLTSENYAYNGIRSLSCCFEKMDRQTADALLNSLIMK